MQRPWNIPNLPVYSLATYNNDGVNMNICTYVSAVSMYPKLYMVAVYENTLTLENITAGQMAVLQLLHKSQYALIRKLGQTSGKTYNKQEYLQKKSLLQTWQGYNVLKGTSALILLQKQWNRPAGDHHIFVFSVAKSTARNNDCLTLQTLRDKRLIRG
ncbi:MAG: flavin reductase [Niastella sp.]|nr:flavin reductase [Niastella sp.]